MEKVWLVRPKPHNINRMREFLSDNIIAIGWPELSSLVGKTKDDIHTELVPHPLNYTPVQLGAATSTVNRFVNEMRVGDIIVVPDDDNIYFCKLISDYFFDQTKSAPSEGYPHQRKVEWLLGPVRRGAIPEAVRISLRAPRTLIDLSNHQSVVSDYLGLSPTPPVSPVVESGFVEFEYPLRLDTIAKVTIPKDITQAEAIRLSDFVKTLYFE